MAEMSVPEYAVAVIQGVPMPLMGQLSEATGCSVGQLADLLGITRSTAYRMERNGETGCMKHFEGDAVADLARLVGEAQVDAGQSRQALAAAAQRLMGWLELPSKALEGVPPAAIMRVGAGRDHVLRLWKRDAARPKASA